MKTGKKQFKEQGLELGRNEGTETNTQIKEITDQYYYNSQAKYYQKMVYNTLV